MKKKHTVKRISRLLTTRNKIYSGGGLTIFAASGTGKIGVAVTKTVKGAVKRNRIKRHLREYARKEIFGKTKKDVVLIAGSPDFRKEKVEIG